MTDETPETTLPPECDFCGQALDDGEELTPVFVGEPPEPKPQRIRAESEKTGGRMGGHSLGAYAALRTALSDESNIGVKLYDAVARLEDTEPAGVVVSEEPNPPDPSVELETDHTVASADVHISPDFDTPDPDMRVCPYCTDSFTTDHADRDETVVKT